jgi:hypothetical protein
VARRVALVCLSALVLSACGQAAAPSRHGSPRPHPGHADASRDVLTLADLGDGWTIDPSAAYVVSLKQSMRGDAAATKRIERRTYRGGYEEFALDRDAGYSIASSAFVYSSPAAARAVALGWDQTGPLDIQDLARIPVPGSASGMTPVAWRGTFVRNGDGLPVFFEQWVSGNVLANVAVTGVRATPAAMGRLARVQDARMKGHPAPSAFGVGEQRKPALQILRDSLAAVATASTVHLKERTPGQDLDFWLGRRVGIGTVRQGTGVLHARRIGDRIWTSGNAAIYRKAGKSAAIARRLAGRWLVLGRSNPGYVGPENLTSLRFVSQMMTPGTAAPSILGTVRTADGLLIVVLVPSDDGNRTAVWVRAQGMPYPVRIDQAETGGVGHVLLSGWNRPLAVVAPPSNLLLSTVGCSCT